MIAWLRSLLSCQQVPDADWETATKRIADKAHNDLVTLRLLEQELRVAKEALELSREELYDLKSNLRAATDRVTAHRANAEENRTKAKQLEGEVRRCRARFEDQSKSLDNLRQGAEHAMSFLYKNSSEGSEAFEVACTLADKLNS